MLLSAVSALVVAQSSSEIPEGLMNNTVHKGRKTFYAASVYMDYNETIENNFQTLENVLEFTEGAKLIITMDSNARSTTWHEVITNNRGKMMEKFVASYQLHIINEDSPRKTFQSSRGSSNINLTIVNKQMLPEIKNCEILEEESASDHNILKFSINFENDKTNKSNTIGLRCIIKEQQHKEFYK